MIKGKDSYSSQVSLTPDPRTRHTPEERAAQHSMAMKLYGMLERLTMVVDSITDARDQARDRAAKLPAGDALGKRVQAFARDMEERRRALVSTTRSEISGEEKLREQLADLFGNVNFYDGRPTESQVTRMGLLGQELEDAYKAFQDRAQRDLAPINRGLRAKAVPPITPLTEEAWRSRQKP
jgi:hypothetical protein